MSDLEDKVLNEIGKIIDLENGLALSEMKMIRLVREIERSVVKIDFTPTSPFCPMAIRLAVEIKNKAENVDGVKNVRGHIMENEITDRINK